MDDPHERLFQLAQQSPRAGDDRSAAARRRWLRRMLVLLGTSCIAFSLTALWLSHLTVRTSLQSADSQAIEVVQAHFAALHRGDFRAAYALFSTRLQREMPFNEFQEIMGAHLPLLQGKVSLSPETTTARRVVVDIAFHDSEQMDLSAEFTLVRSNGRWWIDDIHWDLERVRPQRHVIYT